MKVSIKDALTYDPNPPVVDAGDVADAARALLPGNLHFWVNQLQQAIDDGAYTVSPLGYLSTNVHCHGGELTTYLGLKIQVQDR